VTASVDTFTISIPQEDWTEARRDMYTGKYKDTVLRVQLICDHSGRINSLHGFCIGTSYDGYIFNSFERRIKQRREGEYFLGG
jgi:hypothetical protein